LLLSTGRALTSTVVWVAGKSWAVAIERVAQPKRDPSVAIVRHVIQRRAYGRQVGQAEGSGRGRNSSAPEGAEPPRRLDRLGLFMEVAIPRVPKPADFRKRRRGRALCIRFAACARALALNLPKARGEDFQHAYTEPFSPAHPQQVSSRHNFLPEDVMPRLPSQAVTGISFRRLDHHVAPNAQLQARTRTRKSFGMQKLWLRVRRLQAIVRRGVDP
jgi:hypothetical protein